MTLNFQHIAPMNTNTSSSTGLLNPLRSIRTLCLLLPVLALLCWPAITKASCDTNGIDVSFWFTAAVNGNITISLNGQSSSMTDTQQLCYFVYDSPVATAGLVPNKAYLLSINWEGECVNWDHNFVLSNSCCCYQLNATNGITTGDNLNGSFTESVFLISTTLAFFS
jgi:hypothetical protein